MNGKLLAPAAILLLGGAALIVFGYNFWSYCCGRCTAGTFLTLGPFGLTLLALNLLAAAILALFRLRRRSRDAGQRCHCGALLDASWTHCPDCGERSPAPNS